MKIINCFILAWILGIFSCNTPYNIIEIDNVSSKDTIKLGYENSKAKIYKIEILITGDINGDATLYQKDNHNFKMPIELKEGKLDLKIYDDWYSTECILEYEPMNVTKGKIQIKYKFYTF